MRILIFRLFFRQQRFASLAATPSTVTATTSPACASTYFSALSPFSPLCVLIMIHNILFVLSFLLSSHIFLSIPFFACCRLLPFFFTWHSWHFVLSTRPVRFSRATVRIHFVCVPASCVDPSVVVGPTDRRKCTVHIDQNERFPPLSWQKIKI